MQNFGHRIFVSVRRLAKYFANKVNQTKPLDQLTAIGKPTKCPKTKFTSISREMKFVAKKGANFVAFNQSIATGQSGF